MVNEKPIIFVKGVVGKNFNGFTLSSTMSTIIEINPDLPAIKELVDWFNEVGFQHASSNFKVYVMADLFKITTSELLTAEMKYYATNVIIKGLQQQENIWYPSCNICKSKVTINEDVVRCAKCSKENIDYSLRYLLKLYVEDETSNAIFTQFDSEVESIIGVLVSELENIKVTSIEEYNKIIKNSCDKEMTFIIKAQDKICGNRTFLSLTVQSIKKDSQEIKHGI
ncbi:replication protein A 70 kDa DNA-binding subunit-like [Dendrobium catenatum]|uniref:replication protein A 70 kDa DNA-binding subunit-like n=1 Tax=Dendrobium catenatum TaxID=906689 RepID=UPI00109F0C66|nr:replication protein A 70 kDa DNA-binding subunit-like [Dendrobium catenatum]XP_028548110.1 replication protein A 70 kDa DNA-binding subunit-like [Dendrobium catenatum]